MLGATVFAEKEIYLTLPFGNTYMNENVGSTYYKHSSAFWDVGLSLGTRLGFAVGPISLGAVGEFGWVGDSINRKLNNAVTTNWYRIERTRTLAGGYLGLNIIGPFGVWGEYYPYSSSSILFSDGGSTNPFRKNDILNGDGYSLGLQVLIAHRVRITAFWRRLITRTSIVLPSPTYGEFVSEEVMAQVGIVF